jgi:hypothetical protein
MNISSIKMSMTPVSSNSQITYGTYVSGPYSYLTSKSRVLARLEPRRTVLRHRGRHAIQCHTYPSSQVWFHNVNLTLLDISPIEYGCEPSFPQGKCLLDLDIPSSTDINEDKKLEAQME